MLGKIDRARPGVETPRTLPGPTHGSAWSPRNSNMRSVWFANSQISLTGFARSVEFVMSSISPTRFAGVMNLGDRNWLRRGENTSGPHQKRRNAFRVVCDSIDLTHPVRRGYDSLRGCVTLRGAGHTLPAPLRDSKDAFRLVCDFTDLAHRVRRTLPIPRPPFALASGGSQITFIAIRRKIMEHILSCPFQ